VQRIAGPRAEQSGRHLPFEERQLLADRGVRGQRAHALLLRALDGDEGMVRLDEELEIADVLQAGPPGRRTTRPFGNLVPAGGGCNSTRVPVEPTRKDHAALSF